MKHGTGTGKTITALMIAKSFLDRGKNVVILGLNKQQFYNEAILRSSLGFVDRETADDYKALIAEQI